MAFPAESYGGFYGGFCLAVTLSTSAVAEPAGAGRTFLLGADISTLTQVEQRGGIFRDAGKADDAISIFRRHGWNCFRLRLFVNPNGRGGVINSLDFTRALAKRIKASGATFLLDIHYSDTWADPQHQVKPAAWKDMDFDAMESAGGEIHGRRYCGFEAKRRAAGHCSGG